MKKTIDKCPHCGSTRGIYYFYDLVGIPYYVNFDGSEEEEANSEMYDNSKKIVYGKTAYCQNCYKAVCRVSTLEKQWGNNQ